MQLISLQSDELYLEIAPEIGGSVARLDLKLTTGTFLPILRPVSVDALMRGGAAQSAMHPLVPFANRARGNCIDIVEPPLILHSNVADEPCALHGIGWQRPWTIVATSQTDCLMELVVQEGDWVFPFRSTWHLSLAGASLQATLSIENISRRSIPAGIGLHPYFHRMPGMQLSFMAERFWLEGPGHLPTDAISLPAELDFANGRPLPDCWRNNCYGDWRGSLVIDDIERGITINLSASASLPELMIYTPTAAPFFCLEPQSHTTGATARRAADSLAKPLKILQPGETLVGEMILASRRAQR